MTSNAAMRRRVDRLLFLGPATLLLFLFFLAPVVVDVGLAFTDMGRNLRVTGFTTANFERMLTGDSRVVSVMGTTLIYVLCTLAFFNIGYALVLALVTTALPERTGAFFRAVWLLPRMSPSVLYILLWLWAVSPTEAGLVNQVLMQGFGLGAPLDLLTSAPIALIIISNGFIGASMGMIIFTAAIRGIPEHLFHAAAVDGAGTSRRPAQRAGSGRKYAAPGSR